MWAELCKVVKSDFYIVCVADSCIVRLVDFSRNTSGEFLEISEVELESRGFLRFRSYCVLQHAHSMRIRSCDTEKKKAGYEQFLKEAGQGMYGDSGERTEEAE